jgi:hypothetical protein
MLLGERKLNKKKPCLENQTGAEKREAIGERIY